MSSHGSAGQPPDPYGRDPYGPAEDPWTGPPADPWGGQPVSTPPAHTPQSPYPPQSPFPTHPPYTSQPPIPAQPHHGAYADGGYWTGPQPGLPAHAAPEPPDGRRQTALIVTVVVLALLLGVGGFTAFLLSGDRDPTTQPSTGPSARATRTAGPTSNPAGSDIRTVAVGQCLVNAGTEAKPDMRVVSCSPGTLRILKRIDGTSDETKCSGVPGYEFYYYYNSELDALDFVLCLQKQR